MNPVVEPEVMRPEDSRSAQVHLKALRVPGFFGAVLAVLTMLTAFGFGFVFFFGTNLLAAAMVTLAWPLVFSPEFTHWVFGTHTVGFWKLFLLFVAAGAVLKIIRRQSWQRR